MHAGRSKCDSSRILILFVLQATKPYNPNSTYSFAAVSEIREVARYSSIRSSLYRDEKPRENVVLSLTVTCSTVVLSPNMDAFLLLAS